MDQTQLIEFGYKEDFEYCYGWRPEIYEAEKIAQAHAEKRRQDKIAREWQQHIKKVWAQPPGFINIDPPER